MNKIARKIVIAVIALITIVSVSGITPVGAQTIGGTRARLAQVAFNYTRNLTVGSVGEDVRALQRFLNSEGFAVATTGAGSPGNESTRFGPRTRDALIRFQLAVNISPARGFFGPITRGRIMALTTTAITTTPVSIFTRDLAVGSTGEDVRALQRFLNARNFTVATTGPGSPGNEATTFDLLTHAALIRFQTNNNISPAHGFFDSVTRERVIALIASGAPGTTVTPGVLSSIISPTTPVSAIVPVGTTGRTDVVLTTVRYTATNEPVILQDITVRRVGAPTNTAIASVEIVDGTRIVSIPVPVTGDIILRDANIEIPATGHRDIIVRADLVGIGHGVVSGQTVELDVEVTRARGRNSNANVTTGLGNIAGGNPMTIRQTVPTFTKLANQTTLTGANDEVLRFTVSADASGDVELRTLKITFNRALYTAYDISWLMNRQGIQSPYEPWQMEPIIASLFEGTTQIATSLPNVGEAFSTLFLTFRDTSRPERNIAAGTTRTFTVRAGSLGTAALFASIHADGLVWRDGGTTDITGALVPGLPVTGDTLRR